MTLTNRSGLKIFDAIRKRMAHQRIVSLITKKMDEAIEAGDFDKVIEYDFLLKRISK